MQPKGPVVEVRKGGAPKAKPQPKPLKTTTQPAAPAPVKKS